MIVETHAYKMGVVTPGFEKPQCDNGQERCVKHELQEVYGDKCTTILICKEGKFKNKVIPLLS